MSVRSTVFKRLLALLACVFTLRAGALAVGETAEGDRAADALRAAAGTQIALISDDALAHGTERAPVTTVLTPGELWTLLEQAAAGIVVDPMTERIDDAASGAGFVQVSGLSLRLDASAPAGERVLAVSVDGVPIDAADESTRLTAALSADLAEGAPLDAPLSEILTDAREGERTQTRITIIGARENLIAERIPIGLLPAGCAAAAAAAVVYMKKLRRHSNVVLSETGVFGGISE